jgi:hypothetical protein
MNPSDNIVRSQVDALKGILEQSRNAHCREVRERAELQAAEIRSKGRAQARERVSRAAHEERARLEREVRMVEAEIETERRRRARQRDTALLEAGRSLLAEALAARWESRADRAEWARAALAEARTVLLGLEWTLEHPPGWPADERDAALAYAREQFGAQVEAFAADDLEIGLRIRTDGALVDMSIPGLLANERAVEGELLAEFERAEAGDRS